MTTITNLKLLIDDLIDTSTSNFTDARKVRLLNKAQDKIVNIITANDYLMQYDDDNYTDLAEGYLDLTSGQNDYNIKEDENFADILFIVKVFAKDPSGTWKELEKTTTFQNTTSGTPTQYYLTGRTIVLGDIPNYTSASGIKVFFVRKPQEITTSDTTKEVGMPKTFHHLLALYVAYDYARSKNMANANDVLREVLEEEQKLGLHVASKDKKAITKMKARTENNR